MKKRLMFFAALVVAALSVSLAASSAFAASVVYDATPSPLPPGVPSLGFEATSTSEFGDYVHLSTTNANRRLDTVTVTMSDWALYSDYSSDPRYSGNSDTWSHPITVNVYSNHLGTNGAPDTLLATTTQLIAIPWRPAVYEYGGIAFNATFDLSSPTVTLPNDVIVGVAYNTADYGHSPIGVAGPYNSLNVGIPNGQTASVGTDDSSNNVFFNTSYAPFYTDGGTGGVGIFRQDTAWTPNGTVAIQITALATCTPTGFFRDGINMTAAQIGGNVTGNLDASGCNIGVYYGPHSSGTVSAANVHGANYYGVVVNAAAVNVTSSSIHDIGESPLDGTQHGVGVFYTTLNQDGTSTGTAATGTISGNTIARYQKGGIVVNGPGSSVTVSGNNVTGEGAVTYTAQNGIQMGRGAIGTIKGNTVSGNAYSGTNSASSCGILVFGGAPYPYTTGVSITANTLTNNDIGVYVANADASGNAPATRTKNSIVNNTITDSLTTNVSGNGYPDGYQAGIFDLGNHDSIVNNKISGDGYNKSKAKGGSIFMTIDVTGSISPHVKNN
jgi:Right handed beta helix region